MDTIRPCDDVQSKAFDQAQSILNAYPNVKLIMAICSPGVPGAAEAVKQSGRTDVHVVGLGLPNENKQYVHEGITTAVVLWNTMDLGYLTVYAAEAVKNGTLKPGDTSMDAGRLKAGSSAWGQCDAWACRLRLIMTTLMGLIFEGISPPIREPDPLIL